MNLKADLHIHTYFSNRSNSVTWGVVGRYMKDSVIRVTQVLESARAAGLDAISITDHDTVEGTLEAMRIANDYGITVIPGVEISAQEGHLLAYGITQDIPRGMSVLQTVAEVHKRGGIVVPAHPFHFQGIFFPHRVAAYDAHMFDAVEVFSAFCGLSKKAALYAQTHHIPQIVGTDSKWITSIGKSYTRIESNSRSVSDILQAIKSGKTSFVIDRNYSPLKHILTYLYNTHIRPKIYA
jgi:hypothetical protein